MSSEPIGCTNMAYLANKQYYFRMHRTHNTLYNLGIHPKKRLFELNILEEFKKVDFPDLKKVNILFLAKFKKDFCFPKK